MLTSIAFALLVGGCAQKKDVDAMDARLKEVEEKLAKLEKGGGGGKAGPSTSPEEEAAASSLMKEAQEALKGNQYDVAKSKLAELKEKYGSTRAGRASARMMNEVAIIGTDAPQLDVDKWFQGKANLADAKATLVVFWEVWCPHCKEEMPKMPEVYHKWKSKGLNVVGVTKVTKSATDEKVETFIKDNKIDFPIGKEKDGALSKAYNVSGIPAAALVKDGKVVWRGHPAKLTDDMIGTFLSG
jgi:peroxiredoxin